MKALLIFPLLVIAFSASADLSYYPSEYAIFFKKSFNKTLQKGLRDQELKDVLFKILAMKHEKQRNGNDKLVSHCSGNSSKCYGHRVLGYRGARKVMFGRIHLEEDSRGYYVKDVYCNEQYDRGVGPNMIPNHNAINCEHTWPQSKFSSRFDKEMQKSDIHHLYPTQNRANSTRGNHEFGYADNGTTLDGCSDSRIGYSNGRTVFEPPTEHKGNVARAIFYFAVRYKMRVSPAQEAALREWNELDPVDQEERDRNDWAHKIQGNRNPFIDFPHLAENISDF